MMQTHKAITQDIKQNIYAYRKTLSTHMRPPLNGCCAPYSFREIAKRRAKLCLHFRWVDKYRSAKRYVQRDDVINARC